MKNLYLKKYEYNIKKMDRLNLDMGLLPEGVSISTMTVTCKLGVDVNLYNFSRHVSLHMDEIRSIKYGVDPRCTRALVTKKKRKKKVNKRKHFFNQSTMEIKPLVNNVINFKLFKNGSGQMTGCKNSEDVNFVSEILVNKLKETYYDGSDEVIVVQNKDEICLSDFKIVMINSNFKIPYEINREALYNLLLKDSVMCSYEPCIHACVNIKYIHEDGKTVSIFVFQSGSIIITGANNIDHISCAHKYIMKILKKNRKKIVKKDLKKLLEKMVTLDRGEIII